MKKSDESEIVVVPGKATHGFAEGEETRLAKIALGASNTEERRAAIKRLRQVKGTRLPLNAVVQ